MKKNKSINTFLFVIVAIIFVIVVVLVLSMFFSVYSNKSELTHSQVIINDNIIWVEIAKTPEARSKGLMGREFLEIDEGMLFIFEEKRYHNFWMENMNFPIDIIWIEDNQIIDISKNVPVPINKLDIPLYRPLSEVNYVVEVNAGYTAANDIKTGDKVEIRL